MANYSKQHCTWRKLLGTFLALGVASCGGNEAAFVDAPSGESRAALGQQCDLAGTWALKIEVPVSWSRNIGVQAGSGKVVQYAKTVRTVEGTTLVDTLQICGIDIPDYRSQVMFGNELYGIRFPDEIFDANKLASVEVHTQMSGLTVGSTWQSDPAAIQLGLAMGDPLTAAWPRKFSELQSMVVDTDGDGHPGISLVADSSAGYSYPPTGMTRTASKRAKAFYTAVRNVAQLSGTLDSCDAISGEATIPSISGRTALNSHVLGCAKVDGTECATSEIDLIDGLQPIYVAQAGTVSMQKVDSSVTCADVRALHF